MEENLMKRFGHGDAVMKKEKRADSSGDEEAACTREEVGEKRPYRENDEMMPSSPAKMDLSSKQQLVSAKTDTERFSTEPENSMASSSTRKEQDDQLESSRAEMGEVREENQRLKMYLNRIMKDYQNLQMQFHDIIRQDANKSVATTNNDHREVEEPELVSLTLGIFPRDSRKDDKNKRSCHEKEEERGKEGLSLGLEYKFEASKSDVDDEALPNPSPANSSQEPKEEETWPPRKGLKPMRSGDDEVLQQNPVKKTRVCVRARCDTPTMNDGCQWRKYGQKIAKGNPCPRAYYRCTVAPSCPVRKQVQRCAQDMSILITTYEGTHNHPLPMSATAMASTTSAAASMQLSGSSSRSQPGYNAPSTSNNTPANLHGLNLYLSDNSKSKFYLPNSSLSAASSHPTITLDLTSTPSSSSSFPFNTFSSAYPTTGRYPATSLSFGSESNTMSWGNGLLSHGSTQPYMKNQIGSLNIGRPQAMENSIYQSFIQKNNPNPPQQPLPTDTIAAAIKAITADPNFQSALAAALTSIIGTGNNEGATLPAGERLAQKFKRWDHPFPVTSSYSQTVKGNGCASYFLNKSPSATSQPGSLMFRPPSSSFSSPKSASASPGDTRNRNHSN